MLGVAQQVFPAALQMLSGQCGFYILIFDTVTVTIWHTATVCSAWFYAPLVTSPREVLVETEIPGGREEDNLANTALAPP